MYLGNIGSGPGRSYRDGSLGASTQTGAGRQYRDGSLGLFEIGGDFIVGAALGTIGVWLLMRGLTLPGTKSAAAAAR